MTLGAQITSTIGSSGRYYGTLTPSSSESTGQYQSSDSDFIGSFYAVLNRWQSETSLLSDPDKITSHPSFRALVKNAEVVTPLIIEEIKRYPSFLVWVLDDAYGEAPYAPDEVGDIDAMTEAWIAWAENNGRTL